MLAEILLISVDTIINHILYQCLDILVTAAINHPQWHFILLFLFLIDLAVQKIGHKEIRYCCHTVCFLLLFYYIRHIIIYFIVIQYYLYAGRTASPPQRQLLYDRLQSTLEIRSCVKNR